jgi:putative ABC transport system permease protein
MNLPVLALRNVRRNRTRTVLTIFGVMIAIFAFGFLRTVIRAYYSGAEAASKERLVTRNAVSLVVPLPLAYKQKIQRVPGVTSVASANWFGGVYKDPKNFFATFAVDAAEFLALYPEYILAPAQRQAFLADPTGAIAGRKLADRYGWKVGDQITLQGSIYVGDWTFTLRGIYEPREHNTDTTQFFFHWKYLDERQPTEMRGLVGLYFVGLADPQRSPQVAQAIDATFKGSQMEALTESERAFQLGFISMVSVVIRALKVVSAFVFVIVALILGNTIAMSVRERGAEIAILKSLGFTGGRLAQVIIIESMAVAFLGGLFGLALSMPVIHAFGKFIEATVGSMFPVFELSGATVAMMVLLSISMGLLAALLPAVRTARLTVAAALRRVG